MTLEKMNEVEKELARFYNKLQDAKEKVMNDENILISGCKETGALKRAALDLKNELTKLIR